MLKIFKKGHQFGLNFGPSIKPHFNVSREQLKQVHKLAAVLEGHKLKCVVVGATKPLLEEGDGFKILCQDQTTDIFI